MSGLYILPVEGKHTLCGTYATTTKNTESYVALEAIPAFSPVFLQSDGKNGVYITPTLFPNITPLCIGVCINSPLVGEIATVQITGVVAVRFVGSPPRPRTSIYIASTYQGVPVAGVAASFQTNVVPYNFNNTYIIKVGTIVPFTIPSSSQTLVLVQLEVNNFCYDLYDIYTLDAIPRTKIEGLNFSFFDIGVDLQLGLQNPAVGVALQVLIDAYETQSSIDIICKAIYEYSIALYNSIPDPIVSGYTKRLVVVNSSGQVVYDSENPNNISVYNTTTGKAYEILLTSNPFGVTKFKVISTLIVSPYFAYIDPNAPDNSGFIGSSYMYPAGGLYEMVQANINGVGISARYAASNNRFNYNVAYFQGLTNSYNQNNGETLVVRLSWKKLTM